MSIDLLIPLGILLIIIIYLIYSRTRFEEDILKTYENKYNHWKENSSDIKKDQNIEDSKKIVGFIIRDGYKLRLKVFDKSSHNMIQRDKYKLENIDIKDI